ncbi:MAG: hypothetical protein ACE5EL_03790, partial [Anaerolineae bacterium]
MGRTNRPWRGGLLVLTLAGFVLRVHGLADVSLRWDEGWSIALAALPPRQMLTLTAQDVHPPLYYLVLAGWTRLAGSGVFPLRYASAAGATLAVPLAAAAARAWCGGASPARRRTPLAAGLAAAALAAAAPGLIYYAGVARMYAFTAPALLVAAWGVGRLVYPRQGAGGAATARGAGAAIAGGLAALHLFYYAAFAVAGLYVAAALVIAAEAKDAGVGADRAGRIRALVAAGVVTAAAAAPWLAYAAGALAERVGARAASPPTAATLPGLLPLVAEGVKATFFAYRASLLAVAAPLLAVVVGAVAAPRWFAPRLLVAAIPAGAVVAAAALGARAHMFAGRYVIVATPFALLGVAWAVAALGGRGRGAAWAGSSGAALAMVIASTVPTTAGYVYRRSAEVTGDFDPAADWRALAPAAPDDLVV